MQTTAASISRDGSPAAALARCAISPWSFAAGRHNLSVSVAREGEYRSRCERGFAVYEEPLASRITGNSPVESWPLKRLPATHRTTSKPFGEGAQFLVRILEKAAHLRKESSRIFQDAHVSKDRCASSEPSAHLRTRAWPSGTRSRCVPLTRQGASHLLRPRSHLLAEISFRSYVHFAT